MSVSTQRIIFFSRLKIQKWGQEGGESYLASRWDREILHKLFAVVYILSVLLSSDRRELTADNANVSRSVSHIILKTFKRLAQTFQKHSKSILVKLNKHAYHFSLLTHDK